MIWLILGGLVIAGLHPTPPRSLWFRVAMTILSWVAAAVLLAACIGLSKRIPRVYPWAIFFLTLASLSFLFDDFGFIDLIVCVLHFLPLALLIKEHTWYVPRAKAVRH